jgi:hypothetical protein
VRSAVLVFKSLFVRPLATRRGRWAGGDGGWPLPEASPNIPARWTTAILASAEPIPPGPDSGGCILPFRCIPSPYAGRGRRSAAARLRLMPPGDGGWPSSSSAGRISQPGKLFPGIAARRGRASDQGETPRRSAAKDARRAPD